MAIKRRGKKLSLYQRVPKRYAAVEPRKFIWLSLHTDSQSVAEQKAGTAWAQLIEGWEAKLAGDTQDAEQRFAAAHELAAARGFRYLRADRVADLPIEEIVTRVDAISGPENAPDLREAEALLGTAEEQQAAIQT